MYIITFNLKHECMICFNIHCIQIVNIVLKLSAYERIIDNTLFINRSVAHIQIHQCSPAGFGLPSRFLSLQISFDQSYWT